MSRHKRCLNFQWRDEDPAWRAERDNDRIVFRKIRKMTIGGLSADRVIAALFRSDFWLERMRGKTRASWKRCYYRWRTKCTSSPPVFGDSVQAEKSPFDPCKHGAKRKHEKFYREPFLSYPPPTATVPSAERNTKMTPTEKLSTAPFRTAKKTERKVSKGKGKETYPGYFSNPLRSARACLRVRRPKPTCSYEFAGAAADEVAKTVWGTRHDRNIWAGFCRYGNCDDIIDRAHLCASMFEQGEIKNPITSLQDWLNEAYPETAAYLASRRNGGAK